VINAILLNVVEVDMKSTSRMVLDLPKIDEKTEIRMLVVSRIVNEVWRDVGSTGLKFVTSKKIKKIMADVIFYIILELREKFEFTRSAVMKQGKTLNALKKMMFTLFG
jgi:hypothetical protein